MNIEYIANMLLELDNYKEKASFASGVAQYFREQRVKLNSKDREILTNAVFEVLKKILIDIKNAKSYKEKNDIFNCEASLMDIVAYIYPNVNDAPEELVIIVKTVFGVVNDERYLENAMMAAFESESISRETADEIIALADKINDDEFHRGQIFIGLFELRESHNKLTPEAKSAFAEYTESELKRFSEMEKLTVDVTEIIEFACDVARNFGTVNTCEFIKKIMSFGIDDINFFAVETLLVLGCEPPAESVNALAQSLVYAYKTHCMLEHRGRKELFPQEYASEEYLAKSDMVQWLCYPTELGKAPDEIELLGDFKVKGEKYFVFIYKSDSDNLDEEHKNKWLIGWSGNEGGTFSNFDFYDDYNKGKPEKTLKHIKRKLIG